MKASYRKQGGTDMKKLYKKIGVILALTMGYWFDSGSGC